MLLKIAEETAAKRVLANPEILAVFLHGAILGEQPLLGGTADVDLTFIYEQGFARREFLRLTDEVHLDINHHPKDKYQPARGLRIDPWLGPTVYYCRSLHDPKHFIDFTQASVRGMFDEVENVTARAQALLEEARQEWQQCRDLTHESIPQQVDGFLRALFLAANAAASLTGPPITERRLLLDLPQRAHACGRPGLYAGVLGLLGAAHADAQTVCDWLPAWEAAFLAAQTLANRPPPLHASRRHYYQRAIQAMLQSAQPQNAYWLLLYTWTQAIETLPPDSAHQPAWVQAGDQLNLLGKHLENKLEGLDVLLDSVAEVLGSWGKEYLSAK
ncbi:MAG: hypothetical protein OEZ02_00515 [Anaerolineae bacterium]|nr:hypothetical protein [Anaerolineae bacterium]